MKETASNSNLFAPAVSRRLLQLFSAYSRHYLRRNFHSIRLANDTWVPESEIDRPIVIYLNHSSWWDPLVCLYLARQWFRDRISMAPIEQRMLEQYAFFKHLGFYPVELGSARGARNFLRTTAQLLQSDQHVLWLTPQARFVDVRERPVPFRRGLGAIAHRVENALFVPMAIDYTFWTEPQPEVLITFGQPVVPEESIISSIGDWTAFFAHALETAQDDLAHKACQRDPSDWFILENGASGINAIYDGWRSLRSRMRGQTFAREHQANGSEHR